MTSLPEPKYKGILITEGADFTIHGIKIVQSPSGVEATNDGISLRQDLCRHWLRIGLNHLRDAASANAALRAAAEAEDASAVGALLEREFQASMQAIVASAIALDALYSSVKERIVVPAEQREAWKSNHTARWKQMAEVFRLGFGLKSDKVAEVRTILRELSKYRGWAVHPPADQQTPVLHPETGYGVEWRFVAFRYHNARATVRMALSFAYALAAHTRPGTEALVKYCAGLAPALEELISLWNQTYPDLPVSERDAKDPVGEPNNGLQGTPGGT